MNLRTTQRPDIVPTSSETSTETELLATRAICALAAIVYPLFWWVHRLGPEVSVDPLSLRLLVTAYALALVALSYQTAFVQRYIHQFLLGLIYLITIHFFVLLALNDLHWKFALGILLILIGMNAGSSLGFRSRRSLHVYLGTVLAGTVVVILVVEDPGVPITYFMTAMVVAVLTSFFGIGAHLKARHELLRSRRRLQTVLSGAPIVFWTIDQDGRISEVEGKGLEALGVRPREIAGHRIVDLFGKDSDFLEATRRTLDGELSSTTVERNGTFFETWQAPLQDVDGSVTGAVGVATDATPFHQLSLRLRRAQKMEAVGRLAGGIAHDFNNILTAILGYAQLARNVAPPEGEIAESLDEIRVAGERAAALVEQLLAFSRRQDLEPRPVDLNQLVRSMVSMLKPLVGEDLVLTTDLGEDVPTIEVDPTGVEQILVNLAVNARDACPGGGTATIMTRGASVPGILPGEIPESLAGGRYAVLEFSDDGIGMDPDTAERVFEPFFTTKPFGKGSGMGLATVYGIVEQTEGAIQVESEPDRGTTFRVWLPARTEPASRARGEPGPA